MLRYADLPRCACGRLYETCAVYDPFHCKAPRIEPAAPLTEAQREHMGAIWRHVDKARAR